MTKRAKRVLIGAACAPAIIVAVLLLRGPVKDALVRLRNPCKTILTEADVAKALGEPVRVRLDSSRFFCDATFASVRTQKDVASLDLSASYPANAGWMRARAEEGGAKVDSLSFGEEGLLIAGGDGRTDTLDTQAWTSTCKHDVTVHIRVMSPSSAAPGSTEGAAAREKTQFEAIELARVANDRLGPACVIGE
jgi:hypothetical protein